MQKLLRSDHRGLRNRDLKLMWVVVVVGGGWWWVVVGVQGKNRNKLRACQLIIIKLLYEFMKC